MLGSLRGSKYASGFFGWGVGRYFWRKSEPTEGVDGAVGLRLIESRGWDRGLSSMMAGSLGLVGLPAVVGLKLLHGGFGCRVPMAGGLAGEVARFDVERGLDLGGTGIVDGALSFWSF